MQKKKLKFEKTGFQNFANLLFVIVMFLIIGTLTPPLIVSFTPADHYYRIDSPAATDKKQYRAGDSMLLYAKRESQVTVHADSVQELVLTSATGEQIEVFHDTHHIPLLEGETDVAMRVVLPDDIPEGKYFWHGVIFFNVRGIEKNYPWNSISFEVVK